MRELTLGSLKSDPENIDKAIQILNYYKRNGFLVPVTAEAILAELGSSLTTIKTYVEACIETEVGDPGRSIYELWDIGAYENLWDHKEYNKWHIPLLSKIKHGKYLEYAYSLYSDFAGSGLTKEAVRSLIQNAKTGDPCVAAALVFTFGRSDEDLSWATEVIESAICGEKVQSLVDILSFLDSISPGSPLDLNRNLRSCIPEYKVKLMDMIDSATTGETPKAVAEIYHYRLLEDLEPKLSWYKDKIDNALSGDKLAGALDLYRRARPQSTLDAYLWALGHARNCSDVHKRQLALKSLGYS